MRRATWLTPRRTGWTGSCTVLSGRDGAAVRKPRHSLRWSVARSNSPHFAHVHRGREQRPWALGSFSVDQLTLADWYFIPSLSSPLVLSTYPRHALHTHPTCSRIPCSDTQGAVSTREWRRLLPSLDSAGRATAGEGEREGPVRARHLGPIPRPQQSHQSMREGLEGEIRFGMSDSASRSDSKHLFFRNSSISSPPSPSLRSRSSSGTTPRGPSPPTYPAPSAPS